MFAIEGGEPSGGGVDWQVDEPNATDATWIYYSLQQGGSTNVAEGNTGSSGSGNTGNS